MVSVPWPTNSAPGARPQESAGRLVNAYAIKTEQGARAPLKFNRSPGLSLAGTVSTYVGFRGFLEINNALISALGQRAVSITNSGTTYTVTDLGALTGTDLITIARNNATTANIVAVTNDGTYNLFTGSAPTSFADPDLPAAISVCECKSYFVFAHASGRLSASDINAVTVNSLSYTTAPAGLIRAVSYRDEVYAFGANFCQVYRDAGTTPFPFELVTTIPVGLAGKFAVAGFEPGFSGTMIWAAQDDIVYKLSGYTPVPISTEPVSRDIAATPDKSVLEASVYMSNGNAFWALTRPGFWTWEHNLTTGAWNERQSYDSESWRISRTAKAFSRWIAGSRTSGAFYEVSSTAYTEGADPLVFYMESGAFAAFPNRLMAPRLDVDMTAAVGTEAGDDPIQTDPQVQIRWSNDGGYRWGLWVNRSLGGEGESRRSVSVNRLGLAHAKGFKIALRVSDPVPVTLFGADVGGIEKRAAA